MTGRSVRSCYARILICLLGIAFPVQGAPDPADAEIAALDRQVAALRATRDSLVKEVQAKPKPAEPPATVTMVFPKLLGAGGVSDLTVTLRRGAGAWIWGSARSGAADQVDASGLTLQDDGGQRRLTGTVRVKFAPDHFGKPAFSENVEVAIVVDARATGDELRGTFRTEGYKPIPEIPRFDYNSSDGNGLSVEQSIVSPAEGPMNGRVVTPKFNAALTPIPDDDIMKDSMEAIYVRRAQARDVNACELYRQIHACALALDRNVDLAHALELTPQYRPVWPVPAAGAGTKPKPAQKGAQAPDLDDVGNMDLGVDAISAEGTRTKPAQTPAKTDRKELMATLASVRAHVESMRQLAEQYRPGATTACAAITGSCPDPDFGPWFGEDPLPADGPRRNVLPDKPAVDDPQDWRRIEGWRLLGPFPPLFRRMDIAALPEVVPAFQAGIVPPFPASPGNDKDADDDDDERRKESSITQGIRGWRGDWTGIYPDAKPPLAWDMERKINVLWEIPLGISHATPVIVGDKLFVLDDPATLICMDKKTGAILWRQESDIAELAPENVRTKIKPIRAVLDKAEERLARLGKSHDERRKALVGEGMTEEKADATLKELSQTISQNRHKILQECGVLGPAWGDWTAHTFSTPVTDGKHIWFKSNTGVLACYDLDGRRRWMVRHGGTTGTNAHTPSPVLAGGRIILMLEKSNLPSVADYGKADSILVGHDAETGKLVWKVDTAVGVIAEVTGTPLPMRLTNGKDAMDVVVTADGSVVRADDGVILRMYIGTRERYGSPTPFGPDLVGITGGDRGQSFKSCYQLLMLDRDRVGVKPLWNTVQPGTLYDSGDYQVAYGGLASFYGARLDVVDANTGETTFRSSGILWRRPGRCYSPLALAGSHLYIADLGNWFGMKKSSFHDGALSVTTATRHPVVLARNRVGKTNAAPVFDEDRIYVRQWYSLLCLGRTGPDGNRFEAEAVARETLTTIFPGRPGSDSPVAVPAKTGSARGRLLAGRMPDTWVMVGPLPQAQAETVRSHLCSCDIQEIAGTGQRSQTSLKGVACRLEPIRHRHFPEDEYGIRAHIVSKVGQEFLEHKERLKAEGEPSAWTESVIMGETGFPGSVMALRDGLLPTGTTAWFVAAVNNQRRRVLRFELDLSGARAWVAGQEIRHNQLVDLPAGVIQLLVEIPGSGDNSKRRFSPRFWPSYGGKQDLADWIEGMEQRRPYLESVIRLCPDSDVSRKAKELLLAANAK